MSNDKYSRPPNEAQGRNGRMMTAPQLRAKSDELLDKLASQGVVLRVGEHAVFHALTLFVNGEDLARPSLASLSRRAGMTERSVRRNLRKLEKLGVIQTRQPSNAQTPTTYQLMPDGAIFQSRVHADPGHNYVPPPDTPTPDKRGDKRGDIATSPEVEEEDNTNVCLGIDVEVAPSAIYRDSNSNGAEEFSRRASELGAPQTTEANQRVMKEAAAPIPFSVGASVVPSAPDIGPCGRCGKSSLLTGGLCGGCSLRVSA